jgi:hypothetical protein
MTEFVAAHHVALTVTNLEVSREWYQRLLGAEPVLDEDVPALPGHHQGFHHTVVALPGGPLLALHEHAATGQDDQFDEFCPGLDHVASDMPTGASWSGGRPVSMSSASSTVASPRTPTASACPSATRTTSPWSSGHPGPKPPDSTCARAAGHRGAASR